MQDEIESAMDEITNNRSIIIGNSKETGSQAGGFVSEEIFNTTNTRNSGEFSLKWRKLYIWCHLKFLKPVQIHF